EGGPVIGSSNANAFHPQSFRTRRLRSIRGSRRRLDAIGSDGGNGSTDRTPRDNQGGTDDSHTPHPHRECSGSWIFSGGPATRAPAGYLLTLSDRARRLAAVVRRSSTVARTSY